MRIAKNTTNIPTNRLGELIPLACRGVNTAGVILDVRNSNKHYATGRIWTSGKDGQFPWRRRWVSARIIISLPRKEPCTIYFRHPKMELAVVDQSREVAFVKILAHEIYHHYQRGRGKRLAQMACDRFACKQLAKSELANLQPGVIEAILREM